MKVLHCRDAGFDCDAVVRAESDDEILDQVRPHTEEAHQVTVDPEMEAQLLTLIRTED
ncbi:MAG TPA: DUF1059 domain-containing protein [Acidimicrobiia bacterium]|nr:DUF1059 domain-containing protein [Acidimicrobiia bacterium]